MNPPPPQDELSHVGGAVQLLNGKMPTRGNPLAAGSSGCLETKRTFTYMSEDTQRTRVTTHYR